jgi:hypothetical protein
MINKSSGLVAPLAIDKQHYCGHGTVGRRNAMSAFLFEMERKVKGGSHHRSDSDNNVYGKGASARSP